MPLVKLNKRQTFFLRNCCLLMTLFTALMILIEPLLYNVNSFTKIFLLVINIIIFMLGPYVLSGKKKLLYFSVFGGFILIILTSVKEINNDKNFLVSVISQSIFLLMCFVLTVTAIYYSLDKKRQWSSDRIFGLIYGYLLLGFLMSEVYFFLGKYGHAKFLSGNQLVEISRNNCLYFSYVVQTTTGFGDIIPGNEFIRRIVVLHACAGVLYTAVLIGRVIGWYGNHSHDE